MRKCEHCRFRWNFYCLPKIRESFSCIPGSAYHGTFCPHRILAFPSSHQASLTIRIASILVIFLSSLLCKYKTLIPPSSPKSPQQKETSKRKDRISALGQSSGRIIAVNSSGKRWHRGNYFHGWLLNFAAGPTALTIQIHEQLAKVS